MRFTRLLIIMSAAFASTFAVAQTHFVDPQNFGASQSEYKFVSVYTGNPSGYRDVVSYGIDGLKFFSSTKNNQPLDRFTNDSRRRFPNNLLPLSSSFSITDLDSGDFNGDSFDDLLIQSIDFSVTPFLSRLQVAMFDPITQSYPAATIIDSFPAPSSPSPYFGLAQTVVTDANNDGLLDVVETRFLANNSIVLTKIAQSAPGVFAAPSTVAAVSALTGAYFSRVGLVAGFIDGDPNEDLALAVTDLSVSPPVTQLYTIMQSSPGIFTTNLIQTTPGDRYPDIKIADANSDGLSDLVFLDHQVASASIVALLQQGTGWQAQILVPNIPLVTTGFFGSTITPVDVQFDGQVDLVLTANTSSAPSIPDVRIYTQTSPGNFFDSTSQLLSGVNLAIADNSSDALATDFNADGWPDLLISSHSSSLPTILIGSLTGFKNRSFVHGIETNGAISLFNYYSGKYCIGDFNNDHNLDLISIENSPKATLHLGDGTGDLRQTSAILNPAYLKSRCTAFDVDLDGDTDVFVSTSLQSYLLVNSGNGTLTPVPLPGAAVNSGTVKTGDMNGDGRVDIIVGNEETNSAVQARVMLNLASGFIQVPIPTIANDFLADIRVGDFDGDLDLDLATINESTATGSTPSLVFFWNDGTGIPTFTRTQSISGVSSLGAADFNNDSLTDLVVAATTGSAATILFNLGNGSFNQLQVPVQTAGDIKDIAVGDFNKDGFSDFMLSCQPSTPQTSGRLALFTNNQAGAFVEGDPGVDIDAGDDSTVADVDNDGDLDVIYNSGYQKGKIKVLLNQESQLLTSASISIATPSSLVLEADYFAPGTFAAVVASTDPLTPGISTMFGSLRLTNFIFGPIFLITSGATTYYPISFSPSPSFVGQHLNIQLAFFDFAGNIKLSNPQSVLLTD